MEPLKLFLSKGADDRNLSTVDHRLCVCVSASLMIVILPCFKLIRVSDLHLGQYSGKFFSSVSVRIFILVFPPQVGQSIHFDPFMINTVYSHSKDLLTELYACSTILSV